jgi:hypothetical protein
MMLSCRRGRVAYDFLTNQWAARSPKTYAKNKPAVWLTLAYIGDHEYLSDPMHRNGLQNKPYRLLGYKLSFRPPRLTITK